MTSRGPHNPKKGQRVKPPPPSISKKRKAVTVFQSCKKPGYTLRLWVNQLNQMPKVVAGHRDHYAIPKANANVIFEVDTSPNNNGGEHAQVTWTVNGNPSGNGKQLQVPINVAGTYAVSASYQGLHETRTLLVIWANIQVMTAGNIPDHWQKNFGRAPINQRPTALGVIYDVIRGLPEAVGRVCVEATLQPPGINAFIKTNLKICRVVLHEKTWIDNLLKENQNLKDITDRDELMQWKPDGGDRIVDLDAPNIAAWDCPRAAVETYMHFQQWVTYANKPCSPVVDWHFIGELVTGTPSQALDAHPNQPPQVVQITTGQGAYIHRAVVAQGPLGVAGIVAPRYRPRGRDSPIDLENHGERP